MAGYGMPKGMDRRIQFMNCTLEVDVSSPKWAKIVMGVIKSIQGVSTCRINEMGMVEVSGTVDPSLLLKKLAKAGNKARVYWFQFGKCSSNLYIPRPDYPCGYAGNNGYYGGYGALGSRVYYGGGGYGYGYGYTDGHFRQQQPPQYHRQLAARRSVEESDEGVVSYSCCAIM